MKIVTSAQMRLLDEKTIESGIPGRTLMERAGKGAAEEIMSYVSLLDSRHNKRFVILAGKGNNAGDAYVVAKELCEKYRRNVIIYTICPIEELKGDARYHASLLPFGVTCELRTKLSNDDFVTGDVVIDGLLGTGVQGKLRFPYDQWIPLVNSLKLPVIALDIPSGLCGDTGSFVTDCIHSDLTITMGLPKLGLIKGKGPELAGAVRIVDIGIPDQFITETDSSFDMIFAKDVFKHLVRIPSLSHKNSLGRVLIIGGSADYSGAPLLAGKAALRTGAGLVTVAVPESANLASPVLSIILKRIPDAGDGFFGRESVKSLSDLIENHDSVVIGPGITANPSVAEMLKELLPIAHNAVLDADALNVISENPPCYPLKNSFTLTPHPGEMKRLLHGFKISAIQDSDRMSQSESLSEKCGSLVVLKGCRTVISSGKGHTAVNSSGSPALATAGTGDVLSGMIGAFQASGMKPFESAKCAVFIHGLAGELSPYGIRGLIADDLIELIPKAMKQISPFA